MLQAPSFQLAAFQALAGSIGMVKNHLPPVFGTSEVPKKWIDPGLCANSPLQWKCSLGISTCCFANMVLKSLGKRIMGIWRFFLKNLHDFAEGQMSTTYVASQSVTWVTFHFARALRHGRNSNPKGLEEMWVLVASFSTRGRPRTNSFAPQNIRKGRVELIFPKIWGPVSGAKLLKVFFPSRWPQLTPINRMDQGHQMSGWHAKAIGKLFELECSKDLRT